jgi:hypothetical protein
LAAMIPERYPTLANLRYKKAKLAEKAVCRVLGRKHLGGPGEPDCSGAGSVVEVKNLKRKVSKYDMNEILEKPWARRRKLLVASTSSFTPGAKDAAKARGRVQLYSVHLSGSRRRSRRILP